MRPFAAPCQSHETDAMADSDVTYCNARLRNGHDPGDRDKIEPGEWGGEGYCRRPTSEGRCRLHGGQSIDGGRPVSHGLYSGRRDELQEKFEQAYRDDRLGSMRAEIATLKALYAELWERIETVDRDTIEAAVKIQGEIRNSLDTASKIQNREAPTQEEVTALVTGVAQLIDEYVPESKQPDAFNELKSISGNGRPRALEDESAGE